MQITDERIFADRIAKAKREKRKTRGDILKDGLFGKDDKSINSSTNQRAKPRLAVSLGMSRGGGEIRGRPRTGVINH